MRYWQRKLTALWAALMAFSTPLMSTPLMAEEPFDYYVMALSWSPSFCATTDPGHDQCTASRDLGFILHGLWPQNEKGWPSYCQTSARPPSRQMTARMADIMGGAGLAWHQWRKHGTCSGLDAPDYFATSRRAYASITRPPLLRQLEKDVAIRADVIEAAFLEVNPALTPEMIVVSCKAEYISEIRVCLTKDLTPRECGEDLRSNCAAKAYTLPHIP